MKVFDDYWTALPRKEVHDNSMSGSGSPKKKKEKGKKEKETEAVVVKLVIDDEVSGRLFVQGYVVNIFSIRLLSL